MNESIKAPTDIGAFLLSFMPFSDSRLKIERAQKHVRDLKAMLDDFVLSDFYSVSIEQYRNSAPNFLRFEMDKSGFQSNVAAVIIGDALHNLRSALDLLYYRAILDGGCIATRWTGFPIFDTREQLINCLRERLKKQRITAAIHDFILETIEPYKAGNYALWALHDLNITDKHKLLIPTLQLMRFDGICLEDEKGEIVNESVAYFINSPGVVALGFDTQTLTVKNKGHVAAAILFQLDTPFQAQAVIPTIHQLAEITLGVVESFERAGFVK